MADIIVSPAHDVSEVSEMVDRHFHDIDCVYVSIENENNPTGRKAQVR